MMLIETQVVLSLTLYKVASLLVGTGFAYMGYRLFAAGIWGNAGSFGAQHQDTALVLKNAAPGTFFALFGAVVISVTLYKGLEFQNQDSQFRSPLRNSAIQDTSPNTEQQELPRVLPRP